MKLRWLLCLLLIAVVGNADAQPAVSTFSNLGPVQFPINVSGQINGMGRVCQMKFDPTNSQIMYAVSSSGGLFISHDNAQTWAHTGTDQLPTTQCSSVCIDYTNNNILYLSTGDPDYYYEDYGIWKSTNGGATWSQSNNGIGNRMAVEILMDPTNHNTLVAATDDGMWKTTNAGSTWTEVVNGGDFKDMKLRPGSNTILYAVTSSSYYKSTDFGSSWTQITNGINVPSNNDGLRLAVSNANPNVVYIGTTGGNGIIMQSTDGGQSFSTVYNSSTQCLVCYDENPSSGSQGNYNFDITANPQNADDLVLVSHCVWTSADGGVSWTKRTNWYADVHTDMHDIKFNPYNNQQLFDANDGGVWLSTDPSAAIWSSRNDGLAATETYHMAQDPVLRQMVDIGTQDNGENHFDGIWKCNGGGDLGSHLIFDYSNLATIYHVNEGNRKTLQPLGGDQNLNQPFTINNQTPALEFVPSIPNVAFYGQDTLYASFNINTSNPTWSSMGVMSSFIQSMASCRADSNILYVVTDDNHIYRSDNALSATPSFTMMNTPGFTNAAATVVTDKSNANVVYLACGSNVYKSSNKGTSWTDITGNLPGLNIVKIAHDDYSTNGRLFVAVGNSAYYKDNTTSTWTMVQGMPTVPQITDMGIYNDGTAASVLRLSTYGRGVWECSINNNLPPVIAFTANKRFICPGDTVHFSKTLYGNISSFTWHFPGGVPSTSTADSPVVIYPTAGAYNVWLTTSGALGTDSLLQVGYISASNGITNGLAEGFEGGVYPPVGWLLQSASGNNWQHIDTLGGFGQSSKCIMFDNYNNDTHGAHDRIITPELDLSGASHAKLSFNVAYAYYSGYDDSLMVLISTDCGKTYSPIYEKDSEVLATAPGTTDYFSPSPTEWRNEVISLDAYAGSSITLSFDNVGHYGQPIYLDDINLLVTSSVNNLAGTVASLQVYPNPATDKVTLQAGAMQGKTVTVNCYNMLGALVTARQLSLDNGSFRTDIDLSGLPRGVYEVRVQSDGGTQYAKKLVLR